MTKIAALIGIVFVVTIISIMPSGGVFSEGDMSNEGGTATVRYADTPEYEDNLYTTNDESNDQALGFYGTQTMNACNQSSGNCYDLDVDISDGEVERIYFPKGGWVDIVGSDCYEELCFVIDENDTEWVLEFI
jgi:hypothetical protein